MSITDPSPNSAWLRRLRIAAIAAWICTITAGWLWTQADDSNDGRLVVALDQWPADSRIALDGERSTLVLFVHPKCPCTSATLSELERALCRARTTLPRTVVVASTPRGATDEWTDTPTLACCRALPDSEIVIDEGGVESARFGATVSGTILVYNSAGRLRYAGGITVARGHEGDNPGADALSRVLVDATESVDSCPPTGCRLVHERLVEVIPAKTTGPGGLGAELVLTTGGGRAN